MHITELVPCPLCLRENLFRKNILIFLQILTGSIKQNAKLNLYICMKTYLTKLTTFLSLALLLAGVLLAGGCKDITPSGYALKLPELPENWVSLLGEPDWRVEWVDPDGIKQAADFIPEEIEIPNTWANPVTAWPYWSRHNIIPGVFKPAGALFPFDANGGSLNLTWEAGVGTVFYWELAHANEGNYSRLPANFNWTRFRELFTAGILSEAVCKDPWLVNWKSAAEKTAGNNFDRRRLVPEAAVSKAIPVPDCPWFGTSPFAQPLYFAKGSIPIFPVRPGINVWISSEGILRANGDVSIFIEWE